jgi:hypothetical protein
LQLKEHGEDTRAGQKIRYVITDYSRKRKRSVPVNLNPQIYDAKRYAELLAESCSTVTKPFGLHFTLV